MKDECQTCYWSRVNPKFMAKNEGCKACKHHTAKTPSSGIKSQYKRAEWADFE